MRLALVSLIALAASASAYAQPAPPASPPPPPASPPPPAAAPAAPATAAPASPAEAPPAAAPATPPAETPPAAEPASPPPPPPPPSPPTDPTAIAILDVLQKVCIPAANGGNLAQLAKADGYRKSGDNWTVRQRDFSLSIEPQGTNATQCHVDVIHPLDVESPGRPIVVALNDWAGIENGWSLYRNDKNVEGGTQYTTRSWTHQTDTKVESLVFFTQRKPDGTPLKGGVDTSQLIYGVQPVTQ